MTCPQDSTCKLPPAVEALKWEAVAGALEMAAAAPAKMQVALLTETVQALQTADSQSVLPLLQCLRSVDANQHLQAMAKMLHLAHAIGKRAVISVMALGTIPGVCEPSITLRRLSQACMHVADCAWQTCWPHLRSYLQQQPPLSFLQTERAAARAALPVIAWLSSWTSVQRRPGLQCRCAAVPAMHMFALCSLHAIRVPASKALLAC